jgi:hypothetical protein
VSVTPAAAGRGSSSKHKCPRFLTSREKMGGEGMQ